MLREGIICRYSKMSSNDEILLLLCIWVSFPWLCPLPHSTGWPENGEQVLVSRLVSFLHGSCRSAQHCVNQAPAPVLRPVLPHPFCNGQDSPTKQKRQVSKSVPRLMISFYCLKSKQNNIVSPGSDVYVERMCEAQ